MLISLSGTQKTAKPNKTVMALFTVMMFCFLGGNNIQAADADLSRRLQQLEKQLKSVQRRVFTQSEMFKEKGASTNDASNNQGVGYNQETEGGIVADMGVRLSQLETELRRLTGGLEETGYKISQMNKRIDTMQRDYDLRFKDLNMDGNISSKKALWGSTIDEEENNLPNAPVMKNDGEVVINRGGAVPLLKGDTAAEQYKYAYSLVRKRKYKQGENSLKEFLKRHPKDTLAGNAKFWLGQSYYARQMYAEASDTFIEGYTQYPKSSKRPSFLLKMAMSFSKNGEKKLACEAFDELKSSYPKSEESKNKRPREAKKAGCK